jgi:hypothetical protein
MQVNDINENDSGNAVVLVSGKLNILRQSGGLKYISSNFE